MNTPEGSTELGSPYPQADETQWPWDAEGFWFGPPSPPGTPGGEPLDRHER